MNKNDFVILTKTERAILRMDLWNVVDEKKEHQDLINMLGFKDQ